MSDTETVVKEVPEGDPLGFVLTFTEDVKVGVWFDFTGDLSTVFKETGDRVASENLFVQGVADVVRKALRA